MINACVFQGNEVDIIVNGDDIGITNNQFFSTKTSAIKTDIVATFGLNIQSNNFLNQSLVGSALHPCVQINSNLTASMISNNVFRNGTSGMSSHGILFLDTITATEVMALGNIARGMKTGGYQLKTAVIRVNNIGTIVDV